MALGAPLISLFPGVKAANMKRRTLLASPALFVLLSVTLGEGAAQDLLKQQLVDSWTLVSSTGTRPDGTSTWGDNPKSLLIFTTDGRFSQAIMRADRKKFSSNSRLQGTAEENASVVQGMIAYFGTYSVDESAKTISYRIE